MIKYELTNIEQCALIHPKISYDHRGEYVSTYSKYDYESVFNVQFVEDDISVSRQNVLRGLHGDNKTWKLIQCLYGSIILAVVDCRNDKFTHQLFHLNDKNRTQVLIPPSCANGHYVLSDTAIFSYKQSQYYSGSDGQFTIRYDDPRININWGMKNFNPIISERDMVNNGGL